MIRVLLADDHAVVRDGLRALLEAQPGIEVVGGVSDGLEAVREAKRLQPDVVVMDIAMPDGNGIEATLQMRDACPSTQILILSMHSTTEHIFRALQAGARGYVPKDSAGAEVAEAVRTVHAGRRYLGRKIAAAVIDDYGAQHRHTSRLDSLSRRERQILQLIAEGRTSVEVGAMLFLSPKTIDTYRSRMMHKLGIGDLANLVKFAIRQGITQLE